jgi:hypothetical protein
MLTLAFAAVLLLAVATAAGSGRKAPSVFGVEVRVAGATSQLALLRLDPASLAEEARVDLGQDWAGRDVTRYAWSPDHRHLVVATETKIRFVDVESLTETGSVSLPRGSHVSYFQWSAPNVAFALIGGGRELWRLDPTTATVLESRTLDAIVWGAQPAGGSTLLLTGTHEPNAGSLGSSLLLSRLEPSGRMRTTSLPGIRTGLEPWRARPGRLLPPRANQAIELARRQFVQRKGVPEQAVEVVSVRPSSRLGCRPFSGGMGYVVTLGANGAFTSHGVVVFPGVESGVGVCWYRDLTERPRASNYDLLRSRVGTWQVFDVPLVVDRTGHRAFVVTSTGPVIEVNLDTMRARSRLPRRRLGAKSSPDDFSWFTDRPVRLGSRIAVSAGEEVKLFDPRHYTVSTIASRSAPCLITAAGDRLFLYMHPMSLGRAFPCDGITSLGPRGARRFSLLDGEPVYDFQTTEGYGYGLTDRGTAIIDLKRGRLMALVPRSRPEIVLLLQPRRGLDLGD